VCRGFARRSPRRIRVDADREDAGGALDDSGQRGDVVEVEPQRDPEAGVERLGEKPRPRRRADQSERGQVHLDRPGHRAFADDDVEAEVLHRRVEDLLDRRREPVDLVHEEDVLLLQVGQDPREVSGARHHRPRGQPKTGAHLPRDDVGERRLSQARRPGQQHVVERLAAAPRRLEEDREVLADLRLPDVLRERLRPQLRLDGGVLFQRAAAQDGLVFSHGRRPFFIRR